MNEPILGKAAPHGYDYRPITWSAFLKIREAAQKSADKFGYPVYLVGSALGKDPPRDIDISVIMPLEDYEEWFKPLPTKQEYYSAYLHRVFTTSYEYVKDLQCLFGDLDYHFDIKVCPDTWWPEKPKMLLAEPRGAV
jgi:hypothetical protein